MVLLYTTVVSVPYRMLQIKNYYLMIFSEIAI